MNLAQLQTLATSVGFPDPGLAAAIAMAESGGDPCAQGDPNIGAHYCDRPNGTSQAIGLWQVHVGFNPQYDATSLLNPTYNAHAAYAISKSGTNWQPWATAWDNAGNRIGYLGTRAPFRHWYTSPPVLPNVTPPTQQTSAFEALLAAAAMAAAAGFAIHSVRIMGRT